MNFSRLEKNLTDNIKEAQLKLGFDNRPMSLNYMQTSLDHLLGCPCNRQALDGFADFVSSRLGGISYRKIKDGVCITVPEEGTGYVNNLDEGYGFLTELVEKVRSHGISLEEVIAVFRKYSDNVVTADGNGEDFDLLVYFADQSPDEYLYCLTAEPCMDGGCHVIYHRFIREDYEDIGL
ncbi:MAG: DUF3877 family protein [Ruminococcus sp.]|nr:DUF3877 family protein [Ruminococcus sp.]